MAEFVHLHNHTHYSLLDAACTPEGLIAAAKADGQTALAITDHGVMFGCFEFYKKAKKAGIKPIIGCEVYVAVHKHTDKERVQDASGKKRNYYHLVLLAKNEKGYSNLVKLTSIGHTAGFYYKPRIDFDLLRQFHEGLIATSACLAGPINAPLLAGDTETAKRNALLLKEIFGDDFYVELQDHGLPEDREIMAKVPLLARELGIKMVVTNDAHYITKEHAVAHNVLLNINKDVSSLKAGPIDVTDLRYRVPEMYLKTQDEMVALFKDFPDAIDRTLEIADKVDLKIPTDLQLPQFPIPSDSKAETLDDYLDELTQRGLDERYKVLTSEILQRASFELDVIRRMGYAGYFLIVADFIRAAREMGVRVGPGRGSAAGSLVAYALGITNIDPLKYDLLFERFLNPDRVSMPDIDVDFSDDKRERVIEYVKEKYGADSVAQIITFGTLSSRAVLKDVGRVLGIELSTINAITDKIPVVMGKVHKLSEALELPELRWLKDTTDPKLKQLIDYSMVLEGFARNSSLHAAGVVIAPGPIDQYVPVYKTPTTEPATQYNMKDLEEAGLLKMDFLGLRTLSIIDNTIDAIKTNHGVDVDIDAIDFADTATYEMFGRGQTLAIFQFESEPMQNALRQLQPTTIEDLIAMNALYRPGPMANIPDFIDRKHGRKEIEYLHPKMQPILERTYGIIVYQEQVMQLVQVLAGFTLAQSDLMRRAMGKKDDKLMAEQQAQFVEGARTTSDIDAKLGAEIFALIQKFASYGFNKSHSAAYAYLAYQTAWLKTHYPAEFLAANMTAELNDQAKIVALIDEAKRFGITLLPPDVNRSVATFKAQDHSIYFGMAGIKTVGISAVESIIEARSSGPFTSLFDVAARVDSRVMNRRILEALVCAGAFDTLHDGRRGQLFAAIEPALEYARAVQNSANTTMESLFGDADVVKPSEPSLPPVQEWPVRERLKKERDYLNFYLSGHPLHEYAVDVSSFSSLLLHKLDPAMHGQVVRLCGIVSDIRKRMDKRENSIGFVRVEQYVGSCECVFWSDKFAQFGSMLAPDTVLLFVGKCEINGENVKVIVDEAMTLDQARRKLAKGYVLRIHPEQVSTDQMLAVKQRCGSSDAQDRLSFCVVRPDGVAVYDSMTPIKVTDETTSFLIETFGDQNVRFAV